MNKLDDDSEWFVPIKESEYNDICEDRDQLRESLRLALNTLKEYSNGTPEFTENWIEDVLIKLQEKHPELK